MSPSDVGLPEPKRRRTPGLRREDVATLSGMSLTWYTYLEQGRDVRVSENALDRLSRLLRLSSVERDYLFELAQHRAAPLLRSGVDDVSPATERLLLALRAPACVLTMRWDVVAWNPVAERVLCDFSAWPDGERNLLKLAFAGKLGRPDNAEAQRAIARRFVAKLKLDYSQFSSDPSLNALVEHLSERSPLFRELWATAEVGSLSAGHCTIDHPALGVIDLELASYVPEGCPTLRMVILSPHDAESARKVEAAADWAFGESSVAVRTHRRADRAARAS